MKVKKIIQITQEMDIDINGIILLFVEEYEACKANIKLIKDRWWLRSPGHTSSRVMLVGFTGGVYGIDNIVNNDCVSVRPALKISKSNNLQIGDAFEFGDKRWTVIGDGLALADEVFCQMPFRKDWKAEDANVYEASDIKKYLDEWLVDKQMDELIGDG